MHVSPVPSVDRDLGAALTDLERALAHLLDLAGRDPDLATARFDALVALHGPEPVGRALRLVAGDELAALASEHGRR